MTQPLDFQSIIMALDAYWAKKGCLIWHPYYQQVGAGTYNPATFLRVLGPEPWNVAYLEPSIRPDDGRYGDNPNRFQQFYQYQVILKPDPGNPQELYLESLLALGIDPHQHDIRFVEDNWQSPALGAWGLGWEVWCDGQEITQYTYFQQAGGYPLDPVSVELTYGLERIAMTLQKVRSFRDIQWSPERTDGDVNLQGEREHSTYYYEIADVGRVQKMYELYEAEASLALSKGLVLPAHDYILKLSHAFNILDARGAVGVTERQAMFAKMRDLSHRVAEAYLAQREQMGYPWLKKEQTSAGKGQAAVHPYPEKIDKAVSTQRAAPGAEQKRDFLLEIGTEELPVNDLDAALEQLRENVPSWLDGLRLEHGEVQVLGTPRRLVVSVAELAAGQPDREVTVKGPPANRAFSTDGKLTPAGEGFARSKGIDPKELKPLEMDGGTYAAAVVKEKGRTAIELLSESLPDIIAGIKFDKSMRWNASQVTFSRPIRWLVALLGSDVVPFEYAGLRSGRETRGLRFHEPEIFAVRDLAEYKKSLQSQGIILSELERRQAVAAQVRDVLAKANAEPEADEDLVAENANLVEAPTALLGNFDESSLKLPADVLVAVMEQHQRYFPVREKDGKLLPHFVLVRNGGNAHAEVVVDGNEQVIAARYSDAEFFIQHDLQHKLEELLPRLGTLTFQKKLGSMLEKSQRIEKLVDALTREVKINRNEATTARRAARLCKADLVSKMVIEMTNLQGVMGRFYALHSGEPEGVAQAIFEQYLPRFAGDNLPAGMAGTLIGIADRLDSLAGLFAAGMAPSGTKDPFALRRAALGLVLILAGKGMAFNITHGLALAARELPVKASEDVLRACAEFVRGRLQSWLLEQGFKFDVVAAVLAEQGNDPAGTLRAVKELVAWVERPDWNTILPAYARCVRITRDQKERYNVREALFVEEAEKALYKGLLKMESALKAHGSVDALLNAFVPHIPTVNTFFDKVLVMAEDAKLRSNRLGLLQRISALASGTADLSLLEGF
jgi:glycyl-tRNA synthetase